jgi:hypothetical protein
MNVKPVIAALAVCALAACSTTDDVLGHDDGHVHLSCAGSQAVAGVPPIQGSLSPLAAGTQLEILKPAPDAPVLLTMPDGIQGDEFNYAWKEASNGPGRLPGTWLCRAAWQYDGELWQLSHLDAQWVGGAAR